MNSAATRTMPAEGSPLLRALVEPRRLTSGVALLGYAGVAIFLLALARVDLLVVAGTAGALGILLLLILSLRRALRAERGRVALLAEAADPFTVVTPTGQLLYSNPAAQRILGGGDEDFTGQNLDSVLGMIHPVDLEATLGRLAEVMSVPDAVANHDVRVRHADGSYRWLRVAAANRVSDPSIGGIVFNFQDVTAEHDAEERLTFQSAVLANVADAVIVTDPEGMIRYWNQGAARVIGYTADEVTGCSVDTLGPVLAAHLKERDLVQLISPGEHLDQWSVPRRDGTQAILRVSTTVMRGDDGRSIAIVDTASDVTERFHSRETLTRLRNAIEQSSEAVVITNARAEIEYVNPAFERISGYSDAEVIGENPRLLQGGQRKPSYYETMWASLAAGRPWVGDFVNRRKDGSLYEASAVISPIRDDHGADLRLRRCQPRRLGRKAQRGVRGASGPREGADRAGDPNHRHAGDAA